MDQSSQVQIDVSERFPNLSHAPITEAIIEFRARGTSPWGQAEIRPILKLKLADYPENHSTIGLSHQVQVKAGQSPTIKSQDLGWQGEQFTSNDKKYIAKFQPDLFVFSRLAPYDRWESFTAEAMRLWSIYFELAHPVEIQRLGVRFINRFPVREQRVALDNYFISFPKGPANLDLTRTGFLHQDVFTIPGNEYGMTIIKTVQPPTPATTEPAIILDIDVYTLNPFETKNVEINKKLNELRWWKNKSFFGAITENLKESLL